METNIDIPRILVVEDDPDQRDLIAETLSLHYGDGATGRITCVETATECLALNLNDFDIILQDYHLPDMNGLDLVREILVRAEVPVIFVTGENSSASAGEAIRRGAQDYVVKLGDYLSALPVVIDKNIRQHALRRENNRLQQQFQRMLSELRVKNVQLEESLEKLKTMAATDHLTGLANRRKFSEVMDRYMGEAQRYAFDVTVCMCDLDHYKQLNDTLGHQVGDQVLVKAADVIRQSLRGSDVAARYGGDEFVIVLPHTSIERATAVCERIRSDIAKCTRHFDHAVQRVTMSIGMASLNNDCPGTADELLAMADRALYVAKDRGKDCIVVYRTISRELAGHAHKSI